MKNKTILLPGGTTGIGENLNFDSGVRLT